MVRKLLRLCAVAFSLALLATPVVARGACPDFLYWNEDRICSYVSGTSCERCKYYCDGTWNTWDLCDVDEGGG